MSYMQPIFFPRKVAKANEPYCFFCCSDNDDDDDDDDDGDDDDEEDDEDEDEFFGSQGPRRVFASPFFLCYSGVVQQHSAVFLLCGTLA